jgi:hypothetical protein
MRTRGLPAGAQQRCLRRKRGRMWRRPRSDWTGGVASHGGPACYEASCLAFASARPGAGSKSQHAPGWDQREWGLLMVSCSSSVSCEALPTRRWRMETCGERCGGNLAPCAHGQGHICREARSSPPRLGDDTRLPLVLWWHTVQACGIGECGDVCPSNLERQAVGACPIRASSTGGAAWRTSAGVPE